MLDRESDNLDILDRYQVYSNYILRGYSKLVHWNHLNEDEIASCEIATGAQTIFDGSFSY